MDTDRDKNSGHNNHEQPEETTLAGETATGPQAPPVPPEEAAGEKPVPPEKEPAPDKERAAGGGEDHPGDDVGAETGPGPDPAAGADEGAPSSVRTVGVIVKGQNRSSHFNAGEHNLKPGDEVVIQSERGKAIGVVTEAPVHLACRGCLNRKVLRKASPEEIARDEENRVREREAYQFCSRIIEEWELPMRLVKVEFLFDRSKSIFYFTAEKRVDFRELVRTLAKEFSTRIEMRQIGIRDEAKLIGGVGPCGMEFCCSSFLGEFAPISVKMAKEQNVILNPNKISGGCGRLLCCLNYEYEQYMDVSRGLPKIGKKITLPEGSGRVRSIDIFRNTITVDMPENKVVVIDIDEYREKMK